MQDEKREKRKMETVLFLSPKANVYFQKIKKLSLLKEGTKQLLGITACNCTERMTYFELL